MDEKDWNIPVKELFNMIQALKEDFSDLRLELKETRQLISQYNGLRKEIAKRNEVIENLDDKLVSLQREVDNMNSVSSGRQQAFRWLKDYGGWIVAIISLLYAISGSG